MITDYLKYLTDPEFLKKHGISQDDANKFLLEVLECMQNTTKKLEEMKNKSRN